MYSNEMMENDAVKQSLQQRYRKATAAWRFRHLTGKGGQSFATILTSLLAFFLQ